MRLPLRTTLFVSAALCIAVAATMVFGHATSQTQKLRLSEPVNRELANGQTHEYQIALKAGEFMQARVEQKGVDVLLSLHAADGKELSKMNSPNGKEGFETLSFIAVNAGNYLFRVSSPGETGSTASGTYIITLLEKRTSAARDSKRIQAEQELFTAFQAKPDTTEKTRAQLEKYEVLQTVWRELKDDYIVGLIEKAIADLRQKTLASSTKTDTNSAPLSNVTGKWNMIATGQGQSMPVTIELKQDGENITGTFSSHVGNGTVPSGKVVGNTITALARMEVQGQLVELRLKGKIDGDKMSGSLSGAGLPPISFTSTRAK